MLRTINPLQERMLSAQELRGATTVADFNTATAQYSLIYLANDFTMELDNGDQIEIPQGVTVQGYPDALDTTEGATITLTAYSGGSNGCIALEGTLKNVRIEFTSTLNEDLINGEASGEASVENLHITAVSGTLNAANVAFKGKFVNITNCYLEDCRLMDLDTAPDNDKPVFVNKINCDTNSPGVRITASVEANFDNIRVEGTGVFMNVEAANVKATRCQLVGGGANDGFVLNSSANRFTLSDSFIETTGGRGVEVTDAEYIKVSNCEFKGCLNGIWMDQTSTTDVHCAFSNLVFYECTSYPISIRDCNHVTISNCTSYNGASATVYLYAADFIAVSNITSYSAGAGNGSIMMYDCEDSTVSGITSDTCAGAAVWLNTCSNIAVSNLISRSSTNSEALHIEGSSRITATGIIGEGGSGAATDAGIRIIGAASSDIAISNGHFDGGAGRPIRIEPDATSSRIFLSNIWALGAGNECVYIHDVTFLTLSNIITSSSGSGTPNILIDECDHVTITGGINRLSGGGVGGAGNDGLHLDDCTYVNVTGVQCYDNDGSGIQVSGASSDVILISGCSCHSNAVSGFELGAVVSNQESKIQNNLADNNGGSVGDDYNVDATWIDRDND